MNRAACIDINEFTSIPDLRGCVADGLDVADLLTTRYGFGPGSIRLLQDADATLPNVEDCLAWLADGVKAGDKVLLQISSHGSLAPDRSGDESSGYDSVICLHDMDWSPGSYLLDDRIGAWVRSLPAGARAVVLIDACHCGTGTREVSAAQAGVIGGPLAVSLATQVYGDRPQAVVLTRYVEPPAGVVAEARRRARSPRSAPGGPELLALTACRDDQTAADAHFTGVGYRGAFSYYLCRALRSAPNLGRAELHRRVARDLARARFQQEPQLEALPTRGGLFGLATRRAGTAPP